MYMMWTYLGESSTQYNYISWVKVIEICEIMIKSARSIIMQLPLVWGVGLCSW